MNSTSFDIETASLPERGVGVGNGPSLDEVSVSELRSALWQRRKLIAWVVLASAAATTAVAFVIPVKYSAEAVIYTPQQQQSSLSAMGQMAGASAISGLAGLSLLSGFGLRNSTDLSIGILQSRSIADALINRFHLKNVYHARDYYAARKRLARNTSIKSGRDTLIRVRVEDRDPKRCAELANAYVDELARQNSTVTLSEATERRLFFERQLSREKDALADAEIALRNTQETTGLVAPTGQADALMRSISQLHTEILTHQAQLEALKTYVTEENPRFQMVKRELGTLQAELRSLEQGNHISGTPEVPTRQLPQAGLEYVRRYRDLKYHETLYEVLARQYEAARLDEAKAGPSVQIIDPAVIPERKSWPPRTLLILGVTALAFLAVAFWIWLTNSPKQSVLL